MFRLVHIQQGSKAINPEENCTQYIRNYDLKRDYITYDAIEYLHKLTFQN